MKKVNYNDRVVIELNETIEYPDFTVEYLGDDTREGKVKWGTSGLTSFRYAKYKIKAGDFSQEMTWGSGTGVISPRPFEINGKTFSLCGFNTGFQAFEGYDPTGKDVRHK